MYPAVPACLVAVIVLLMSAGVSSAAQSVIGAINEQRAQGCGGKRGVSTPLRGNRKLDAVARRLARGEDLTQALDAAGYKALHSSSLFLSQAGGSEEIARVLARRSCAALTDPSLREIGIEQRGRNTWIVLAAPFATPALTDSAKVSARVLALANEARSRPRRCGRKAFNAAPPLRLAERLSQAAQAHARDMARHSRLAHEGSDGSTPADRATRAGYAWRTVAENVAAGPTTPEEVMAGWLASPGHCENLMDPRFTEMGIAYTVDAKSTSGVWWAQMFATPR